MCIFKKNMLCLYIKYIYIYKYKYVNIRVAQYTDVTVRYAPRFGGHGSIRFWYNKKKIKYIMLDLFSSILNRQ